MTCGDCGKQLVERTVATKTKKVDGDVIVLAQRQALVCDEHGVVAWDPPRPLSYPVPPYVTYGGTHQLSANQCASGGVVPGTWNKALARNI